MDGDLNITSIIKIYLLVLTGRMKFRILDAILFKLGLRSDSLPLRCICVEKYFVPDDILTLTRHDVSCKLRVYRSLVLTFVLDPTSHRMCLVVPPLCCGLGGAQDHAETQF